MSLRPSVGPSVVCFFKNTLNVYAGFKRNQEGVSWIKYGQL